MSTKKHLGVAWGSGEGDFRNGWYSAVLAVIILLTMAPLAAAQTDEEVTSEPRTVGAYNVHQTIEFGGHVTDFTGNGSIWNTMVNEHSGPRLLNQSLDMRSTTNGPNGLIFDELHMSSFGYGGDPNDATRLNIRKFKWYDFTGSFRRDRYFWDYDLLANPLNPTNTGNTAFPADTRILLSPHRMDTVRKLTDLSLTIAPQSPIRLRLGYGRNVQDGPSFSSFHEGTDILLFQDTRVTTNSYHIGADFRILPQTQISYDQFLNYYKGDTNWQDQNFTYRLPDGTPLDLGLPFDPGARSPCAAPIIDQTTNPPTGNPTCNGYTFYNRSGPVRTSHPVEQVSFISTLIPRVDLTGRVSYASADAEVHAFRELGIGEIARTLERQFDISGPTTTNRIDVSADLGAVVHVTDKFRIRDTFRWNDFRIPSMFTMDETALFGRTMASPPVTFDAAGCAANAASCPPHVASSPADVSTTLYADFFGQDSKVNLVELLYDFNRFFGARIGYRYENRFIGRRVFNVADEIYFPSMVHRGDCADPTIPLEPDGTCHVTSEPEIADEPFEINQHSLLFGFWTRPISGMRITFDLNLMSADNTYTRVSPRNLQQYKTRINYAPRPWLNLGGSFDILERRNNIPDVQHVDHNRSYSFDATVTPNDRFNVDVAYGFDDVFSNTDICFVSNPAPATAVPSVSCGAPYLEDVSFYNTNNHFFSGMVSFKPIKRVKANLGYVMTKVDGNTLLINPLAVSGPLQSTFHRPSAGVLVELVKDWYWNTQWNYYGYNEEGMAGPTLARDAHGNVVTMGIRYSF